MNAWTELAFADPGRLDAARREAHHASQLLAIGIGRSLAAAEDDDSHTALHWDAAERRWYGAEIPKTPGVRAELRPEDLTLSLAPASGAGRRELALSGRTLADAREWLAERVTELGGDGDRVSLDSHYEIPPHAVASGAAFSASPADLRELANHFGNAELVLRELASEEPRPPRLLTWPHHFDMAILVELAPGAEGQARSVGVGFSPGDDHYEQPYYYVSPYPYPDPSELPELESGGHWHTKGFVAAILPAERFLGTGPEQASTVRGFLESALGKSRTLAA